MTIKHNYRIDRLVPRIAESITAPIARTRQISRRLCDALQSAYEKSRAARLGRHSRHASTDIQELLLAVDAAGRQQRVFALRDASQE